MLEIMENHGNLWKNIENSGNFNGMHGKIWKILENTKKFMEKSWKILENSMKFIEKSWKFPRISNWTSGNFPEFSMIFPCCVCLHNIVFLWHIYRSDIHTYNHIIIPPRHLMHMHHNHHHHHLNEYELSTISCKCACHHATKISHAHAEQSYHNHHPIATMHANVHNNHIIIIIQHMQCVYHAYVFVCKCASVQVCIHQQCVQVCIHQQHMQCVYHAYVLVCVFTMCHTVPQCATWDYWCAKMSMGIQNKLPSDKNSISIKVNAWMTWLASWN